jgi:hypothetical protein
MHGQTTENLLSRAREQVIAVEEPIDDDSLMGIFQNALLHAIDTHTKLISELNNLVIQQDDDKQDSSEF